MTLHYYLDCNKKLKSNERSIYCYIRGIEKGKTIVFNTKQKIAPSNWNKETERAFSNGKNKFDGARELNDFLDSYATEIKKTYRKFLSDEPTANYESVREVIVEKFGKSKRKSITLFETLDYFIAERKKEISPDSIRKFKTLKKHLLEFERSYFYSIEFSKMDLFFYDKFLSYLVRDKKLVNNSAYKLIGMLKIFLNWSHDRGINKYEMFRKFKLKEDNVEIITLTDSELDSMFSYDFSNNKRLERARDLFLFGCYTGGRFTDLVKICREDIRDDTWYLRTNKTRDILEIPLNEFVLKILKRYEKEDTPLPRISNQKLNKYLKEIAKIVGLNDPVKLTRYRGSEEVQSIGEKWKFITVHTARRTFITLSLLKGMKAEIIMSISGHKNFKTFRKYVDITKKSKKDELFSAWNKN